MVRMTITVPDELARDINRICTDLGISKSAFLSVFLMRHLFGVVDVLRELDRVTDADLGPLRNRGGSVDQVEEMVGRLIDLCHQMEPVPNESE